MTRPNHPPTRTEALERLQAFLPHAGRDYATRRNFDLPGHPHVSVLSPYLRHRLILETEVLGAVLGRFSQSSAEKFVQEVFWRAYFKGWLEMRPGIWRDYRRALKAQRDNVQTQGGLRREWEAACRGETGIDAFDHWARELVETGYLHNHARMWFASIWIFTLRLPWELGADFFYRHLLDGDAASNTLSWRWVAGLHTRGKHYLARPDNIARYTDGRFRPGGLNTAAGPLDGPAHPERMVLPQPEMPEAGKRTGLILHDEDLSPGFVLDQVEVAACLPVSGAGGRSVWETAGHVHAFTDGALADSVARFGGRLGDVAATARDPAAIVAWAKAAGLEQVVTPYAPVGPVAKMLDAASADAEMPPLVRLRREYDSLAWPHAKAGFFGLKKKIPGILSELRL